MRKQQVDALAPPEDGEDAPVIKPQATALRAISIAIHDVFTRLYDPLRRASGMSNVTRAGTPGNALQEIASHIAAAINANIQRHFWKRQVAHIRLRQEGGPCEGAGDQHHCGRPPTCAGRFVTGADRGFRCTDARVSSGTVHPRDVAHESAARRAWGQPIRGVSARHRFRAWRLPGSRHES